MPAGVRKGELHGRKQPGQPEHCISVRDPDDSAESGER